MKIKVLKSFRDKLNHQVEFIAKDKPGAARKFKTEILRRLKEIPKMPLKNGKSIFFEKDEIRDLIFKGLYYRLSN